MKGKIEKVKFLFGTFNMLQEYIPAKNMGE